MKNVRFILAICALLIISFSLPSAADVQDADEDTIEIKKVKIIKKTEDIEKEKDFSLEVEDESQTVRMGEDLTVLAEDTIRGDAVVINGNLDVIGFVEGDAVCIGGNLFVSGYVHGDATVIGGNADIEGTAVINGDLVSVGGRISRAKGARVGGEETSISLPIIRSILPFAFKFVGIPKVGVPYHPYIHPIAKRSMGFGLQLIKIVALIVFVLLIILFFKGGVEKVSDAIENHFWKSALAGFIGALIIVPLTVLLAVIIIGIPLIPILWIVIIAGVIFGYTGISYTIGSIAARKKGWKDKSPYLLALIGLVVIEIIAFLGSLIAIPGGPFAVIGGLIKVLGFVISYIAWMIGFGGVILTKFGARKYGK